MNVTLRLFCGADWLCRLCAPHGWWRSRQLLETAFSCASPHRFCVLVARCHFSSPEFSVCHYQSASIDGWTSEIGFNGPSPVTVRRTASPKTCGVSIHGYRRREAHSVSTKYERGRLFWLNRQTFPTSAPAHTTTSCWSGDSWLFRIHFLELLCFFVLSISPILLFSSLALPFFSWHYPPLHSTEYVLQDKVGIVAMKVKCGGFRSKRGWRPD